MDDNSMLSQKALEWLRSIGYAKMDHQQRMTVIEAAKIAYPLTEEERQQEAFLDFLDKVFDGTI